MFTFMPIFSFSYISNHFIQGTAKSQTIVVLLLLFRALLGLLRLKLKILSKTKETALQPPRLKIQKI